MNRHELLQQAHLDKTLCALPWQDLRLANQLLIEQFGICHIPEEVGFLEHLRSCCGSAAVEYYEQFDLDHGTKKEEQAFYEWMSIEPIAGAIHSQKRVHILDSIALLTGLSRHLKLSGPALDIGCNIGYTAMILNRLTGMKVIGLDSSTAAIRTAREKAVQLDFNEHQVEFTDGKFPVAGKMKEPAQFELIYSCSGGMKSAKRHLQAASRLLRKDGVLVLIVQKYYSGAALRDAADGTGLGLAYCDQVGGFTGRDWSQVPAYVFCVSNPQHDSEGATAEPPTTWPEFANYANRKEGPEPQDDEKGQAYFRTWQRYGWNKDKKQ